VLTEEFDLTLQPLDALIGYAKLFPCLAKIL
jgi:hypothetical protein